MYYYELTITDKAIPDKTSSYQSEVRRPFFKGVVSGHIHDCIMLLHMVSPDGFKIETHTFIYEVAPIK